MNKKNKENVSLKMRRTPSYGLNYAQIGERMFVSHMK